MVKRNLKYCSLLLFLLIEATGCIKVKPFTKDEIKWFNWYNKNDTVIFISSKKELDTMIFYKRVAVSDTIRNIELGYYNENYLTVPYKLTKGSYHQFALISDRKTRYDQDVFNISKNSDGRISLEITFLGTIFNGKELNNIQQLNNYVYYFDSSKATYIGVDEEQGKAINNFTFDVRQGITKYTDQRNVEWERK